MTAEAKKTPIIIGIAGGTGAGKTTFAKSIYEACGGTGWGTEADGSAGEEDCNIITHLSHDDYYKDLTHLSFEERAKVNFDHPSSLGERNSYFCAHLLSNTCYISLLFISSAKRTMHNLLDTDLLIHHLKHLLEGKTVVVPRYDFKRHLRYQEGEVDDNGRTSGRVVESKDIILVEGILILGVKELVNLMDLKVYVVSG